MAKMPVWSRIVRPGCGAVLLLAIAVPLAGCKSTPKQAGGQGAAPAPKAPPAPHPATPTPAPTRQARSWKVVHVFVALCDNANQGIAKVPAALGNGQDPASNLYWGARFGVDTFFQKSPYWGRLAAPQLAGQARPRGVLARSLFKAKTGQTSVFLLADAYDGAKMGEALTDFFRAAAGLDPQELALWPGRPALQAGGFSDLVCFVGHNGLMDVRLATPPARPAAAVGPEGAIVLACKSDDYFPPYLQRAACPSLVTTHGLMAPEAYTLDAALRSWAVGGREANMRRQAAAAYARYQKCSPRAAAALFGAGP